MPMIEREELLKAAATIIIRYQKMHQAYVELYPNNAIGSGWAHKYDEGLNYTLGMHMGIKSLLFSLGFTESEVKICCEQLTSESAFKYAAKGSISK
jgi:hypothetical protein